MKTKLIALVSVFVLLSLGSAPLLRAERWTTTEIAGPPGSGAFGTQVRFLSNGNFVVMDPAYAGSKGAIYLYNGRTAALISALRGGAEGDQVGSGGLIVLPSGNYLVLSPNWANGSATQAGAVTWVNADTGIDGTVSPSNSLVGSQAGDMVSENGAFVLGNGNYVVLSPSWANGSETSAGAVTWANGQTGITGAVSPANSLVGSQYWDRVGNGVQELNNGNYVAISSQWNNGSARLAGAVTWANGQTGITGAVSPANSLVGSQRSDSVGGGEDCWMRVTSLSNGDYVVPSCNWANGSMGHAGAVTWADGETGVTGPVSPENSLVGSHWDDEVGNGALTDLGNGNYVITNPSWWIGAGAVTWVNGATRIVGPVSAENSLVGSKPYDGVGSAGSGNGPSVIVLPSGNYLVRSPSWGDGSSFDVGAVTWVNGATGLVGPVSASNSLVGSRVFDRVGGAPITVLKNGNAVVRSSSPAIGSLGAVTWIDGATGLTGVISAANSLVGSQAGDAVGSGGVTELRNGNYVVSSSGWANGSAFGAGAVTWVNGATGLTGPVSTANSLVGSRAKDWVGASVTVLKNGDALVKSANWANGSAEQAGAVTWIDGAVGLTGVVSPANSLVGSQAGDRVGSGTPSGTVMGGVTVLADGNYIVISPVWANGSATAAGALTWVNAAAGRVGPVTAANSLVGSQSGDLVGSGGITELGNGNYVIMSPDWANGPARSAGAVTWVDGATPPAGPVTAANSLVGSQEGDQVGGAGSHGVTVIGNGNYVVNSPNWAYGTAQHAGAVTWATGTRGVVGPVSPTNSLTGSHADDRLELNPGDWNSAPNFQVLDTGDLIADFPMWDNGETADAGAIVPIWADQGAVGVLAADNSLSGTAAGGGPAMNWSYDQAHGLLAVGRPADNLVTLAPLRGPYTVSGRVTGPDGLPAAGVRVVAGTGIIRSAVTGEDGSFTITDLTEGTHALRPYEQGFSFAPASRSVVLPPTRTGQDFVVGVSPVSVAISGPTIVERGQASEFAAAVGPVDTSNPITYSWSPEPSDGQGSANANYAWASSGSKLITVTAANAFGSMTGGYEVVVREPGRTVFVQLDIGWEHSFAVREDGSLAHWGHTEYLRAAPPAGTGFVQVSAGSTHACALKDDGSVVCWGTPGGVPGIPPPTGSDFVELGVGPNHACAVKQSGSIACWGADSGGAATAPAGTDFAQVSAGWQFNCALKTDGSLYCWGSWSGQSNVPSGTDFIQVSAGDGHACALKQDTSFFCWPGNWSQGPGFVQVSAGYQHTCAISQDGSLTCWGENGYGQATPPAGTDFIQVSAGAFHTCALRKDRSITCWGKNDVGQASPPNYSLWLPSALRSK